jgi:hypothetical protein
VNFEPVSDLFLTQRRDYPLADPTLANPLNAAALVDGEWVKLDTAGKLSRATAIGSVGQDATVPSTPLWSERGRSDTQSVRKHTTLVGGWYEADTRIFDAAATIGGAAAITTVGQALKVATITIGARNYCGLVGALNTDPYIVGYVTKLPANNGGKLRFSAKSR